MSATVLYMSMSLDGFITGPNDNKDNGLGDGGEVLHEWLWTGGAQSGPSGVPPAPAGPSGDIYEEVLATGAVVTGRRTFEAGNEWSGDHHDGVPIFVLTTRADDESAWPLVSYVGDIGEAMARAREAAGDRNVLVHGARTAQLALAAGVLDELEIHLVPVLLGSGRRLFDERPAELELTRVVDAPGVTHLHYRVAR